MTVVIPDPVQYGVWIELNLCDLRKDARFHPDDEIDSLAKGLAIKQLQSIAVCRIPDAAAPGGWRYEVIFGVGRVQAARKNTWDKIRADVYEGLTEFQKLHMIFSENEDRKNASPLYQALVLKQMQRADEQPMTQGQLAEKIGKDQGSVSRYLSLFDLSPRIWENMHAYIKLGIRHFIQLNRLENKDDQWKLAEITREKGLSSSELAALIDKQLGVKPASKAGRPKGDKNVGAEGFVFFQRGSRLRVKANLEYDEDAEALAELFKIAFRTWQISHPPVKPKKLAAR